MPGPSLRVAAFVLLVVATLIQCGGGDSGTGLDPNKPSAISLVSGDAQSGTVAHALGQPLVVRVLNVQNQPINGATVTWSVAAGAGSLSGASTTTNAQGDATVTWTVGTTAGNNNNTARASAVGRAEGGVGLSASAAPHGAPPPALRPGPG